MPPLGSQENQYDIYDFSNGEPVAFVQEKSECFQRCCFGRARALKFDVMDSRLGVAPGTLAFRTDKPCKMCCCACADICRWEASSALPDGTGFQHAKVPTCGGGGCTPTIEIMSREGAPVERTVTGPTCCIGGLV